MQAFPKGSSTLKLEVSIIDNPLPDGTLGSIGISVEVRGPNSFPVSILTQPFEMTKTIGIDPLTIRFFRYDNKSKSLHIIPNSGSNVELGFIWAKISRSGIYVAVGLPQDLVIRELLRIMSYQHRYADEYTESNARKITKIAFNSIIQCTEEELEELRRMVTLNDVQTRASLKEDHILRGNSGTILPYPLPGNCTLKEFKERLERVKVPPGGLPEEILFSIYENTEGIVNDSFSVRQNVLGDLPTEELDDRSLLEWSTRLNAPWIPFLCFLGRQNWWTYHHDERLTGVASCSNIRSTTISRFHLNYSLRLDGPITSIPSIVWNKIYVGTANSSMAIDGRGGTLYKIDLGTGMIDATFTFNTPSGGGSRQGFAGIGGSPAVYGNKVYFSGLDGKIYCLDALTLTLIWKTDLRNTDFIHNQPVQNYQGSSHGSEGWSSPLVVKGRVYIGFGEGESNPRAGTTEKPNFGYVYCLDANTGNVIWLFCTNQISMGVENSPNVIPPSNLTGSPPSPFIAAVHDPPNRGASPWSSCCYNNILNRIYIGTGNSITDDPLPDPKYASGVLSLDASTGQFKGFFQPSPSSSYRPSDLDVDVPAGPMLFDRGRTRILAIGSKNGTFFLLDSATMTELGHRHTPPVPFYWQSISKCR